MIIAKLLVDHAVTECARTGQTDETDGQDP